jgi:hypothetical protein
MRQMLTEKRQTVREILLQKAKVQNIRSELNQLLNGRQSNSDLELDYDGRSLRLMAANQAKEQLDAQFERLTGHFTEKYHSRLTNELRHWRQLLLRNRDAISQMRDSVALKKAQLEAVLNLDLTVEIARQRQRIEDLQMTLRDLHSEAQDAIAECNRVFEGDPEVQPLRTEMERLKEELSAVREVKAQKRDRMAALVLELKSKKKVFVMPATPRSKARRRMHSDTEKRMLAQSLRSPILPAVESSLDSDEEAEGGNRCSRRGMRPGEEGPVEMMMQKNREELAMSLSSRLAIGGRTLAHTCPNLVVGTDPDLRDETGDLTSPSELEPDE